MKKHISILFILLNTFIYSQNDSTLFFDEYNISINTVNSKNNNDYQIGFGFGAYHTFLSDKIINVLLGLEFNHTNQHLSGLKEGHFQHVSDVTFSINSLSIPLTTRINIGSKVKIFIETGIYADINLIAWMKGTRYSYVPNENNQIEYKEYDISESTGITTFNYGISLGFGIKIPFFKHFIIVKPEYKLGLRTLYDYQTDLYNSYIRIVLAFKFNQKPKKNTKSKKEYLFDYIK